MKKFILKIIVGLLMVGCGLNCQSKPPKRAIMHTNGGMGMQYHFSLYTPIGDAERNSLRCTKYEYVKSDLYTDSLGTMSVTEVLFIMSNGSKAYAEEHDDIMKITISKTMIKIHGFTGHDSVLNEEYTIVNSSPSSWGVPITGN